MKFKVVGPRVLIKVKKFSMEEFEKKHEKVEGSSLILAPKKENMKDLLEMEIAKQNIGEVVALGTTAYKRKDSGCDNEAWVKIGDLVHFSRYGAVRLYDEDEPDHEHWVLNDKDILVIESKGA